VSNVHHQYILVFRKPNPAKPSRRPRAAEKGDSTAGRAASLTASLPRRRSTRRKADAEAPVARGVD